MDFWKRGLLRKGDFFKVFFLILWIFIIFFQFFSICWATTFENQRYSLYSIDHFTKNIFRSRTWKCTLYMWKTSHCRTACCLNRAVSSKASSWNWVTKWTSPVTCWNRCNDWESINSFWTQFPKRRSKKSNCSKRRKLSLFR